MALYAFDGTWNDAKDRGEYGKHTNVVAFHDHYEGTKHIYRGVGTRYSFIGRLFGGAFGVGGRDRIRWAQRHLAENFKNGDRAIDVVGFSRGAALALHFTNVVEEHGVVGEAGEVLDAEPRIRFLGLWDLVASFGIPFNLGPISFQRINLGYHLKLPGAVDRCYHALALDERRQTFRPTRVKGAHEVWFRGVHSDVGGGNDNEALSNIALCWMLQKAIAVGLPIAGDAVPQASTVIDAAAPIRQPKDLIKNRARVIGSQDRTHYTVTPRPDHVNPPGPAGRWVLESQADESTA
jgi:uncharacterized protein (DUF2235 family)